MHLTGQNSLGTKPTSTGKPLSRSINPATNADLEPPYHEATESEIDSAMQLAEKAFESYRRKSAADRAAFLNAIASEIEALGDALINKAVEETALPPARITGERARTTGQLRMFSNMVAEGSWV